MLVGLSTPIPLLAGAALLSLGTATFATVAVRAPAFNEALQVRTVTGSQRVAAASAMYDPAVYFQAVGEGFLNPEAQGVAPPDADADGDGDGDGARARQLQLAKVYLRESLRRDPVNAWTWTRYGTALAAAGDGPAAAEALARSHRLDPAQPQLARARIDLVATLRGLTGDPEAHADLARADLAVLETLAPDAAAGAAEALAAGHGIGAAAGEVEAAGSGAAGSGEAESGAAGAQAAPAPGTAQ